MNSKKWFLVTFTICLVMVGIVLMGSGRSEHQAATAEGCKCHPLMPSCGYSSTCPAKAEDGVKLLAGGFNAIKESGDVLITIEARFKAHSQHEVQNWEHRGRAKMVFKLYDSNEPENQVASYTWSETFLNGQKDVDWSREEVMWAWEAGKDADDAAKCKVTLSSKCEHDEIAFDECNSDEDVHQDSVL